MKLDRIRIKNFRSIKDETIHLDQNCKILVGKNEAGKSNVLKAIASVFGEYSVSTKDRRKRIDNEKIDEYFVRAIVKLDQTDIDEVFQRFNMIEKTELIELKNKKSIQDLIKTKFHELIIQIDTKNDSSPFFSYWQINDNDWGTTKKVFIKNNTLSLEGDTDFNLKFKLFEYVKEVYTEQPINCNYWQYKEDFLLPGTVSIDEFVKDPGSQKALENIFTLCNRADVKQEFEDAIEEDGDYTNLLEQISKATTKVFHSIWKDFKQTRLALIPNGKEEILIKVVNKTNYSFEDRSDGFKKFISILLMLSTQSRSNKFDSHDIILIDEPDQSLYPTSVRYLRDELLKIAEKALVIYTTHSQYMIDSRCIDRHLIVEKIDDITTLKAQDSNAPFSDDELLRNAIGSSIFECLQPINIIFEGWLDKQLFEKYCVFNRDKSFDEYGKVFLRGISGLEVLVQLLILANKKFLIVADSDKTSNDKRKDFEKYYPEYKNYWLSYGDVESKVSTMEDFLTQSYINTTIKESGHADFTYDLSKNAIQNIDKATSNDKDNKQTIKKNLIMKLTKSKIESDYSKFISELKKKLKEF
ncbi:MULTISPECIES: ATP-dependent endonuclease [unclassified Arenibacter]|uniref:ATP-dependent nuclease n=1 Tax=unclassified Arenibacter TaxID=2615047 RepID=UPI000E34480E|nr:MULTISPECIES: AAA family ATPase [unclassified Arenibacter]MCM4162147.1 hypothetical protein [Arenibacter sp. A80]RFT57761.1 DUF2813 domain-containing protein [Arenibacter sp. P308M17]